MDKTTLIGGGLLIGLVTIGTIINPPSPEAMATRERTNELFKTEQIQKVENKIARERWDTAVEVYALEGDVVGNKAVGIQEGQPVYDGTTGVTLAPGTVVRDFRGVTAVIDEQGNAGQIAIYFDLEKTGITNLENTEKTGVNQ